MIEPFDSEDFHINNTVGCFTGDGKSSAAMKQIMYCILNGIF